MSPPLGTSENDDPTEAQTTSEEVPKLGPPLRRETEVPRPLGETDEPGPPCREAERALQGRQAKEPSRKRSSTGRTRGAFHLRVRCSLRRRGRHVGENVSEGPSHFGFPNCLDDLDTFVTQPNVILNGVHLC